MRQQVGVAERGRCLRPGRGARTDLRSRGGRLPSQLSGRRRKGRAVPRQPQQQGLSGQCRSDPCRQCRFNTALAPNSNYLSRAAGADPASKYAMRIASADGIVPWFMGVLGVGAQSVSATAVATLAPSQVNCGIPLAMCSKGPATGAPPFGLNVGQWYSSRFSAGGGISGNFNWIDFTPPSGGESELSSLMTGSGVQLERDDTGRPDRRAGQRDGEGLQLTVRSVHGGGGNPSIDTATSDFTGYSYTAKNWPAQSNALGDFRQAQHQRSLRNQYQRRQRDHRTQYQQRLQPDDDSGAAQGQGRGSTAGCRAHCRLRRLGHQQHDDYPGVGVRSAAASDRRPERRRVLRVSRLSSDLNSPCATSGAAGGPGSVGPQVPTLVQ